ncbi:unnamed protein product [Penicillium viridicatum]
MRVSRINDLENRITLHSQLHVEFQTFKIALQPMADVHWYKLLPASEFLDTRFRPCEISHASGFAEEVEENSRRWDQIKQEGSHHVLQEDGSTNVAEFLQTGLFGYI